jgi:hypothetical protein
MQIASQEMWGGPAGNYLNSNIPKVKAFSNELPYKEAGTKNSGVLSLQPPCRLTHTIQPLCFGLASVRVYAMKMGTLKLV